MKALVVAVAALGACWTMIGGMSDPAARIPLEQQVLSQLNWARQHPRDYAAALRDYRRNFDGDLLYLPGQGVAITTSEGTDAVDEAIAFLEHQDPLPPLTLDQVLTLAARDHADAQGPTGTVGHVSADDASPGQRVKRRGGGIYVGEGISYGFDDAAQVVRQLIVDDGVPGRGHRRLVYDANFRFAGIGCGAHRRYGHMCVMDFARTPRGDAGDPSPRRRMVNGKMQWVPTTAD